MAPGPLGVRASTCNVAKLLPVICPAGRNKDLGVEGTWVAERVRSFRQEGLGLEV
jgi:hypothetical protein